MHNKRNINVSGLVTQ